MTDISIFDEYRLRAHHQNKHLIKDGIVDNERWSVAPKRILFLLKEAYAPENEFDDLCDILKRWDKPKYTLWNRVAEIVYGVWHINDLKIPPFDIATGDQVGSEALKSIAVVNIKKSGGISSSNDEDLSLFINKDRDLLTRQILDANPQIIFCGGTFQLANGLIFNTSPIDSEGSFFSWENRLVVSYWHPSYQVPAHMYYYTFIAKLLMLKQNGLWVL